MYGIGYRTSTARSLAGRALKTVGVGAALAVGAPVSTVALGGVALPAILAGASAYAAGEAALNALDRALAGRSLAGVAGAVAGFGRLGGPGGFIAGNLLGFLLSYLAYLAANRGAGFPAGYPGFTAVLSCEGGDAWCRAPLGDPAACNVLVPFTKPLGDPYSLAELNTGFQILTENLPQIDRGATQTKYAPIVGAAKSPWPTRTDERPYSDSVMAETWDEVRGRNKTNPWPWAATPAYQAPRLDQPYRAVPPQVDAEAQQPGRIGPAVRLPWILVRARRDAGNPARVMPYGWHAGPRRNEFPVPGFYLPGQAPAVEFDQTGPKVVTTVKANARAVAGTHERKVQSPTTVGASVTFEAAWKNVFGTVTEVGELIDAIYDALTESIRIDDYRANGNHELSRAKKLHSIYVNYKALNVDKMISNIVFNNLQDFLIGKASGDIASMTGGSPLSRTLGAL